MLEPIYILWAEFKTVLDLVGRTAPKLITVCVNVNYSNVYSLIKSDIDLNT